MRSSERQSLVGPPESMREHVVAGAKAMRHGDWDACANYIVNKKMNVKVSTVMIELRALAKDKVETSNNVRKLYRYLEKNTY